MTDIEREALLLFRQLTAEQKKIMLLSIILSEAANDADSQERE